MANIFKNAKFGDKFRTKNGRMAVLVNWGQRKEYVVLYLKEDGMEPYGEIKYNLDGTIIDIPHHNYDIVGLWDEHKMYTKEIHFYTNLCNEEQTSEWDLETMCTDYVSTVKAIEIPDEEIVKTTQLYLLSNAWDYIDRGYQVFIHNSNKRFEVKEGIIAVNGKEIRRGHNICKLLCAGVFGKIE